MNIVGNFPYLALIVWSVLLLIFLALFVLFSGLEYAYLLSNPLTLELKRGQKSKPKNSLGKILDQPDLFWKTSTAALAVLTTCITLSVFGVLQFIVFDFPISIKIAHYFQSFPYMLLLLTGFIVLILIYLSKRIIAKKIFERKPENKISAYSSWVVAWSNFYNPIMQFFMKTAEGILVVLFNVRVKKDAPIFTGVNTDKFYKQSIQGHQVLEKLNKKLVHGAIDLTQISVKSCITPRNEIIAIPIDSDLETVRQQFLNSKVSKLIVYEKHMDKILGYIHHLDLNTNPTSVQSILLPLTAVPETMSAFEMVRQFTSDRKSIALVIDEFGGTAGVVTMADILDEIFGNIMDEYDSEEWVEKKIGDNEFVFSGRLKLDYLNQKYAFHFPADGTETLSGFIIDKNGGIPKQRQKIIIGKFEFEILLVTHTKIESVRMKTLLY